MSTMKDFEPPQRRRIFLLRHGAVKYFARRSGLERHRLAVLTDEGRRQAAAVRDALAGVTIDRVFSSPIERCLTTAAIIVEGRALAVEPIEDLREIEPGNVRALGPERTAAGLLGAFKDLSPASRFLGGERFCAMQERAVRALAAVIARADWQSVLIVAHEAVNRALLAHALGAGLEAIDRIEQDTCGINILDVDASGHLFVRLMNYLVYDPLCAAHRTRTLERVCVDLFDALAPEGP